jgi:hypothetical protein
MMEDKPEDIHLSADENDILTADFSMDDVFEAISQMEHNKSRGPDRFPLSFINSFGI